MTNVSRVGIGVAILALTAAVVVVPPLTRQAAESAPEPDESLERRVYQVCEAYAGLDLSELAPLCVEVGYQDGATPRWPIVYRPVMPEDLDDHPGG